MRYSPLVKLTPVRNMCCQAHTIKQSAIEFDRIHSIVQSPFKLFHTGIPFDFRITGNTSCFFHCFKSLLAIARHLDSERKTAAKDTLMEKYVYCTGHIQPKIAEQFCCLLFDIGINANLLFQFRRE